MKTILTRFVLLVFAVTFMLGLAACKCMYTRTCDLSWKRDEVAFLGKVTALTRHENKTRVGYIEYSKPATWEVQFSVAENFRGAAVEDQEIVVFTDEGAEGYAFTVGTSYLVFAFVYQGQLHTDICLPTAPEVGTGGLLRELRAARDGQPASALFGTIAIGPRSGEDLVHWEPLGDIKVRAIGSTSIDYSTTTDKSGAYWFYSLPPDSYLLEVQLPTGLSIWEIHKDRKIQLETWGCRADIFARPDGRTSGIFFTAKSL